MATKPLTQPVRRPVTQPLIDLRQASVSFPDQRSPAFSPVDLAVGHGELVTLTGPDTATLADRERTSLRGRLIGIVFQRPQLLPTRSALDNVMLPVLYSGMSKQERVEAA